MSASISTAQPDTENVPPTIAFVRQILYFNIAA
jgi:hypothetical protein